MRRKIRAPLRGRSYSIYVRAKIFVGTASETDVNVNWFNFDYTNALRQAIIGERGPNGFLELLTKCLHIVGIFYQRPASLYGNLAVSPKKHKRQIRPKNRRQIPASATTPQTSVVTRYISFVRGHVIDWVSSGILTVVAVAALFHFTSPPTRSVEVRARLSEMAASRLQKALASQISKVTFDTYRSESLDLSATSSFVVFGTAQTTNGTNNRFLMVFEPSSQKLLDQIVGRPGFYDIGYWAVIPDVGPSELTARKLDVEDLDRDGNKDIVIYLRSSFADSTAKGLLVLRKDKLDTWHLMGLPSLTQRLHSLASAKPLRSAGLQPVTEPKLWFSSDVNRQKETVKSLKEVAEWGANEWSWTAKGARGDVTFWMIRNGTKIQMFDHKLTGYKHLGVLANLEDGEAVLAAHHLGGVRDFV